MILAADNMHGLNPVVADAMKRLDPAPIRDLATRCQEAGATWIDINPGYLSRKNEDRMNFLVETVQDSTDLRLILDSPSARILARGLSSCREKPILNGVSAEPQKLQEILPLAAEHKTELIIFLMDDRSFTPPTLDEKIALALEMRDHALSAGLSDDDLIYDPLLPNMSWDDANLRVAEALKTVRLLASGAILQDAARTIVGLSNLGSGMGSRYPAGLDELCLSLFAGAGLSIVMANVLRPEPARAFSMIKGMI